jgi:hypothetical protein
MFIRLNPTRQRRSVTRGYSHVSGGSRTTKFRQKVDHACTCQFPPLSRTRKSQGKDKREMVFGICGLEGDGKPNGGGHDPWSAGG